MSNIENAFREGWKLGRSTGLSAAEYGNGGTEDEDWEGSDSKEKAANTQEEISRIKQDFCNSLCKISEKLGLGSSEAWLHHIHAAIDELQELAARDGAEPVAFHYDGRIEFALTMCKRPDLLDRGWTETPLYAHPPKQTE